MPQLQHAKKFNTNDVTFDVEYINTKIVDAIDFAGQWNVPEGYNAGGALWHEYYNDTGWGLPWGGFEWGIGTTGVPTIDLTYALRSGSLYDGNSPYGKGIIRSGSDTIIQKLTSIYSYFSSLLNDSKPFQFGDYIADSLVVISFKKHAIKDGIHPGSVEIHTLASGSTNMVSTDTVSEYTKTNRTLEKGGIGFLYKNSPTYPLKKKDVVGAVYYDYGIILLDLVNMYFRDTTNLNKIDAAYDSAELWPVVSIPRAILSASYSASFDNIKTWIPVFTANSIEKRFSATYFCRGNKNEFNYSTNPTYVSSSFASEGTKLNTVKPQTYITTVGLYSEDGELMAVGKLQKPYRKNFVNDVHITAKITV